MAKIPSTNPFANLFGGNSAVQNTSGNGKIPKEDPFKDLFKKTEVKQEEKNITPIKTNANKNLVKMTGGKYNERIVSLPAFLGGGEYTVNDRGDLIVTDRNYAGIDVKTGNQRDHIVPVSLGGVSTKGNITYEELAKYSKTNTNTDDLEIQMAKDLKAGKISLPEARLKVLSAKQKQVLEKQGITENLGKNFISEIIPATKKVFGIKDKKANTTPINNSLNITGNNNGMFKNVKTPIIQGGGTAIEKVVTPEIKATKATIPGGATVGTLEKETTDQFGLKKTTLSSATKRTLLQKVGDFLGNISIDRGYESTADKVARDQAIYNTYKFLNTTTQKVAPYKDKTVTKDVSGTPQEIISLNDVSNNFDAITKELGVRNIPTTKEAVGYAMLFPLAMGAMTNPLSTVASLAAFKALGEVETSIGDALTGQKHEFLKSKEVSSYLPEETSQAVKDIVDIADFIAKGVVMKKIYQATPSVIEKFTKDTIVKYNLPKTVTLNSEQVMTALTGRSRTPEDLPPEVYKLFTDAIPDAKTRIMAAKNGITIEIPSETITTFADKPYWAKLKGLFGISPISQTTTTFGGVAKQAPAGLLTGGENITPIVATETFKNIESNKISIPEVKTILTDNSLKLPVEKIFETQEALNTYIDQNKIPVVSNDKASIDVIEFPDKTWGYSYNINTDNGISADFISNPTVNTKEEAIEMAKNEVSKFIDTQISEAPEEVKTDLIATKESIETPIIETISEPKISNSEPKYSKEDPLIEEAKKYKTKEEFIKAQGDFVYRGGNNLLEEKITTKGISVSKDKNVAEDFVKQKGGNIEEIIISPNANIVSYLDIPNVKFKNLNDYSPELDNGNKQIWKDLEVEYQKAVDWAKKNGYDGIRLPLEGEIRIINKDIIKTKSQLETIWENAHNIKQEIKISPNKTGKIIYRGDAEPIDLSKWDADYGRKVLLKETGSSQWEGAGIYLTDTLENAKNYGKNITEVILPDNANIYYKESKRKIPRSKIEKIIKESPDLDMVLSNWDEDPDIALNMLVDEIMNQPNGYEQATSIDAEVFRDDGNAFMKAMSNNGIDGISSIHKSDGNPDRIHYIIYNKGFISKPKEVGNIIEPQEVINKEKVTNIPIEKLTSYEGAPDLEQVNKYKSDIQAGKTIEPIKIIREKDGTIGIEDGKHRFEAYKQLGYKEVPTIDVTESIQERSKRVEAKKKRAKEGIILYHGTGAKFNAEDIKEGSYLTTNKKYADKYQGENASYLTQSKEQMENRKSGDKRTLEYRLPSNAKIFDATNPNNLALLDDYWKTESISGKFYPTSTGQLDWTEAENVAEYLKSKGYKFDAIMVGEGGGIDPESGNIIERTDSIKILNPKILEVIKKPIEKVEPKPVEKKVAKVTRFGKTKAVPPQTTAMKIVSKKPELPILKNLMVKDGKMYSTNLETSLELNTDLPDGIYASDGKIVSKTNEDINDFPESPFNKVTEETGTFKMDELSKILKEANNIIITNNPRMEIRGLNIDIKNNKATLIATDGYRAYIKTVDIKNAKDGKYILNNVKDISKVISALGDNVKMYATDNMIKFSGDNGQVLTTRIKGDYPDVSSIFPVFSKKLSINKNELLNALDELKFFVKPKAVPAVILTPEENKLILDIDGNKREVALKQTDIETEGKLEDGSLVMPIWEQEGDKMSYNMDYLKDAIKTVEGDNVTILNPDRERHPILVKEQETRPAAKPVMKTVTNKNVGGSEAYIKSNIENVKPVLTPEELSKRIDQLNKVGQMNRIMRRMGGVKSKAIGQFINENPKLNIPKEGEVRIKESAVEGNEEAYSRILSHELGHAVDAAINNGKTNENTFKVFGDDLTKSQIDTLRQELIDVTKDLIGEEEFNNRLVYYSKDTELLARFFEKMFFSSGNLIDLAPTAVELISQNEVKHPIIGDMIDAALGAIDKGQVKFVPFRDRLETYQKYLGKRVGTQFYNETIVHRAMVERNKVAIENIIKKHFKNVKDDPALLFKTAEAIKVTNKGVPEFGTRDFVQAKTDEEAKALVENGWEKLIDNEGMNVLKELDGKLYPTYYKFRYTPEEARALYNSLSPEGKQLINDYTADKEEAKDIFNREMIKSTNKINTDLEGWVHHYIPKENDMSLVTGGRDRLKFRRASAKNKRTGQIGYIEDLQKATLKAVVELQNAKEFNTFIQRTLPTVTKPLPEGTKPDKGWVEVQGDLIKGVGTPMEKRMVVIKDGKTFVPKRNSLQMPRVIYEQFKLFSGEVKEASKVMQIVNDINRYWRINILTHLGSAATNAISGGLQFGSKILTDFYTEVLTGNVKMDQTRRNVTSMLEALLPRGWIKDAPDWIYGGDISTEYGQFANEKGVFGDSIDKYADKALKVYGAVERYWKKVIALSENARNLKGLSEMTPEGLKEPTEMERELIAEINRQIDLYAYDYNNLPDWLSKHRASTVGQIIKPFAIYPYKYAKHILNLATSIFDRTQTWQERLAKLMALTTMVGVYAAIRNEQNKKSKTPSGDENTPARLSPRGRLYIGTDKEGKEVFMRTAKYPFLNLTDIGTSLIDKQWTEAQSQVADFMGTISPIGEIGLIAGTNYENKYDKYTPVSVQIGNRLSSYVPMGRVLSDISAYLDPFKRKQTTFSQTFSKLIPTTNEDLQNKLHGEIRTEKVPMEGVFADLKQKGSNTTTFSQPLVNYKQDILLSSLLGIYNTRIDPNVAEAFQIRSEKNAREAEINDLVSAYANKYNQQTTSIGKRRVINELYKSVLGDKYSAADADKLLNKLLNKAKK